MIYLFTIILLTLLQLLAGFGVVTLCGIKLRPSLLLSLSLLLGIVVFSVIPFLLQLFYIPLTASFISIAIVIITWLLNWHFARGIGELKQDLRGKKISIAVYEIPLMLVITALVLISVWRCFYLPPTPRDLTSGAEVIAEYAVKEKTLINSVFSVNLESTNNPFKPPYITSLQVIYKYAGFPFGQIWLSTIFIAFIIFLYALLRQHLHRLLAGLLIIIFIAIPEMYAYTFMALYDYSNAVFFCLSLYFLFRFFKSREKNLLFFSALLMAIATYVRSETLILAAVTAISLVIHHWRHKDNIKTILQSTFIFLLPSLVIYLISVTLYINYYLPVQYNVEGLVRKNLFDFLPFVIRLFEMNDKVIFSSNGVSYYSYFIFIFIGILLIDAIWKEKWDLQSLNWLFGVAVIYIGLPLIAHLFPLFDLDHSTKRGLFKIFPLMLLYMANSRFLRHVSDKITMWENSYGR